MPTNLSLNSPKKRRVIAGAAWVRASLPGPTTRKKEEDRWVTQSSLCGAGAGNTANYILIKHDLSVPPCLLSIYNVSLCSVETETFMDVCVLP